MNTKIQKLEQLHQLVNNEVNGPKLSNILEKIESQRKGDEFTFYQVLSDYLFTNKHNNLLGITNSTERNFFIQCIWNDDFSAFLKEFNVSNSNESDWERYTQNILNVINK